MSKQVEWREAIEQRDTASTPTLQGEYLEGYAIVYNDLSRTVADNQGNTFREIIAPGAFAESLARNNITLVFLHNDIAEYADTKSGTLTLTEDAKGIRFRAALTPYANTLRQKVSSGAVKGMSFGFIPQDVDIEPNGTRIVKRGDLRHISPVYAPAYASTEVKIKTPANKLMGMQLTLQEKS